MLGLGRLHAAESLHPRLVGGVVQLQLVHPLEVERDRAAISVDLDAIGVPAPGGHARELEDADRAAVESSR